MSHLNCSSYARHYTGTFLRISVWPLFCEHKDPPKSLINPFNVHHVHCCRAPRLFLHTHKLKQGSLRGKAIKTTPTQLVLDSWPKVECFSEKRAEKSSRDMDNKLLVLPGGRTNGHQSSPQYYQHPKEDPHSHSDHSCLITPTLEPQLPLVLLDVYAMSILAFHIHFPNKANYHLSFMPLSLHSLFPRWASSGSPAWQVQPQLDLSTLANRPKLLSNMLCPYSFLIDSYPAASLPNFHLCHPRLCFLSEPTASDAPLLCTMTEMFPQPFEPACTSSFTSFPPTTTHDQPPPVQ